MGRTLAAGTTTVSEVGNLRFRQPDTTYAFGELAYSAALPTGWWLDCTVSGTTSASPLTFVSAPTVGAVVADGTVEWTVRRPFMDSVPVGVILPWSSNSEAIPSGYLLCNGAAVGRTMYPDLFAVIGVTYGAGDGSTTFNLPDVNQARRFLQGDTTAGQTKEAGLPNITGNLGSTYSAAAGSNEIGALYFHVKQAAKTALQTNTAANVGGGLSIDASRSSVIYGNSTTVQPDALTMRYLIKTFDTTSADPATIDVALLTQDLANRLQRQQVPAFNRRDEVTVSGTYTAPVTGWYRITVKGGGGGGGNSTYISGHTLLSGGGGGEGGTLVVVKHLEAGTEVSVIVGAGGRKGKFVTSTTVPDASKATSGGDTSISIEGNPFSYVAGGGKGATFVAGAAGGSCSTTDTDISNVIGINGCPGNLGQSATSGSVGWELRGGSGGGAGGAVGTDDGVNGGGGGGGMTYTTSRYQKDGGAGGNGYVWFEYFDTVLNPRSS